MENGVNIIGRKRVLSLRSIKRKKRIDEDKYRFIYENSIDAILLTTLDGKICSANPAACRLFGYTEDELCEIGGRAIVDHQDRRLANIQDALMTQGQVYCELSFVRKDGTEFLGKFTANSFQDKDGMMYTSVIIRDCTERHLAFAQKSKAEEMYNFEHRMLESFFEYNFEAVAILDAQFNFLKVNERYARDNNRTSCEYLGKNHFDLYPSIEAQELFQWAVDTKKPVKVLGMPYLSPDNLVAGITYWDWIVAPLLNHDREVEFLIVCYRNVTEQKRAELKLVEANTKISNILDSITDGFYAFDAQWRFQYINGPAEKLTGLAAKKYLGKNIWAEFPWMSEGELYQKYHEARESNKPNFFQYQWPATGKLLHMHVYPFSEGLSVFFRDITEQERMEREIEKLDRLNIVGEMAASISHEIRNPMTTVRGYLQLMSARAEFAQQYETFEVMIKELDRANGIISEFLSMAKNKRIERNFWDLNVIINNLYPLLEADANIRGHSIDFQQGEEIPEILADEKELRQLILNLARNGLEAMSEPGTLVITTLCSKQSVTLAIADQGTGIPEHIADQIGKPFFTTKEKGTGLGLSVCFAIAARHEAFLTYQTNSSGTTFYCEFPLMSGVRFASGEN